MGKLTLKQKMFAQEYVQTKGNGTKSALRVYDTENADTAHAIATENLQKPSVREELDRILAGEDMKLDKLTSRLNEIVNFKPVKGFSGSDILEAVKVGLKLHGALTDRKQTVSWNIDTDFGKMNKNELIELRKRKIQEVDAILEDETI